MCDGDQILALVAPSDESHRPAHCPENNLPAVGRDRIVRRQGQVHITLGFDGNPHSLHNRLLIGQQRAAFHVIIVPDSFEPLARPFMLNSTKNIEVVIRFSTATRYSRTGRFTEI